MAKHQDMQTILHNIFVYCTCMHAKRTQTHTHSVHTHTHRPKRLVFNDPCFVFFRGARALTSPKTCTSKKEPLLHLHKCSTMDRDARRNVNLLLIPPLHGLQSSSMAWARFQTALLRQKTRSCLSHWMCCYMYACTFTLFSSLCFSPWFRDYVPRDLHFLCQRYYYCFSNMQLSIHDGLAHKNVFHGIPASTTMLIYYGTWDD